MNILLIGLSGSCNEAISIFAAENHHRLKDTPEITSVKKFMRAAERANEYDFVILDINGYEITDKEFDTCISQLIQRCDAKKIIVYAPSISQGDSRILTCKRNNINNIVYEFTTARAKRKFAAYTRAIADNTQAQAPQSQAKKPVSAKTPVKAKGAVAIEKNIDNQAPPVQEMQKPVEVMPVQEIQQTVAETPVREAPQPVVQKPPVKEVQQPVAETPVQEVPKPVVQMPPVQETPQPVVQKPPVQETPQPVVQKPPVKEVQQPVVETPVQEVQQPVAEAPVREAPQPVVQKPPVREVQQPVVEAPIREAPQPVVQKPPVREAPQPVVETPVQEAPKPVVQMPPMQNERQTIQPQSVQWGQTVQPPVISKPPIQESQQSVIPKIPTQEVQKPVTPNTQAHTVQQPVQTPQMRNDQQTVQPSSQWGQTVQSPVMPESQTRVMQQPVAPAQQGVNLPPGMQGALSQNNNYQPPQRDEFVKTKKIGVLGIMPRIGTTTQAVQLARYFTEAGKTTCYIQCNNSNFIDSMEDFFSDIVRPEGRKSLLYEEIEFYRSRNQSLSQQYEYVINDFGCIDESGTIPTDFYNCDFRFIVCGGMASEVAALTKVSQALYSDEHLIYLFSFIEEYDREDILDLVSDRRDKVYFVPYTPDCYCRSEESLEMFNSIFHLRETEKKKKKLFGFRRRK